MQNQKNDKTLPSGHKAKGGKLIPALCNIVGTLILLSVIATCIPVTVPQLMGYGVYNIVSGSMEPEIPIGSAIYVQSAAPESIQEGDVIAFQSGESVVAHRVVRNQTVEGTFKTKGDANAEEDMNDDAGALHQYRGKGLCGLFCCLRRNAQYARRPPARTPPPADTRC